MVVEPFISRAEPVQPSRSVLVRIPDARSASTGSELLDVPVVLLVQKLDYECNYDLLS